MKNRDTQVMSEKKLENSKAENVLSALLDAIKSLDGAYIGANDAAVDAIGEAQCAIFAIVAQSAIQNDQDLFAALEIAGVALFGEDNALFPGGLEGQFETPGTLIFRQAAQYARRRRREAKIAPHPQGRRTRAMDNFVDSFTHDVLEARAALGDLIVRFGMDAVQCAFVEIEESFQTADPGEGGAS